MNWSSARNRYLGWGLITLFQCIINQEGFYLTKQFAPWLTLILSAASFPLAAGTITATLPEFNGILISSGFPQPSVNAGTFSYSIPNGQFITSAVFSSTFGNSKVGNSAGVDVQVGGILAGSCPALAICDTGLIPTPFSYTFQPGAFAALGSGSLAVTATQTSGNIIRLGAETLTITTNTPEPASILLFALGLAALGVLGRRRTAGSRG